MELNKMEALVKKAEELASRVEELEFEIRQIGDYVSSCEAIDCCFAASVVCSSLATELVCDSTAALQHERMLRSHEGTTCQPDENANGIKIVSPHCVLRSRCPSCVWLHRE